jgi:hypothetical protein
MGADSCRLDGEAGGCNHIAVEEGRLFHESSAQSFM